MGGEFTIFFIFKLYVEKCLSVKEYLDADPEKKQKILEKLLSNASIQKGNVAQYKFKSQYSLLANMQEKDYF